MTQHRRDFLKQSAAFSLLLSHPVLAAQATKHSRLADYDALGLADLIKRRQVSPLEVVDDVIRRIEK